MRTQQAQAEIALETSFVIWCSLALEFDNSDITRGRGSCSAMSSRPSSSSTTASATRFSAVRRPGSGDENRVPSYMRPTRSTVAAAADVEMKDVSSTPPVRTGLREHPANVPARAAGRFQAPETRSAAYSSASHSHGTSAAATGATRPAYASAARQPAAPLRTSASGTTGVYGAARQPLARTNHSAATSQYQAPRSAPARTQKSSAPAPLPSGTNPPAAPGHRFHAQQGTGAHSATSATSSLRSNGYSTQSVLEPSAHTHGVSAQEQPAGPKAWSLQDFEIGRELGQGKFAAVELDALCAVAHKCVALVAIAAGQVYLAREKSSKMVVALKVLVKEQLKASGVAHQLKKEVEIHSRIRHNNILPLYATFQDDTRGAWVRWVALLKICWRVACGVLSSQARVLYPVYLVLKYAGGGDLYKKLRSAPGRRCVPLLCLCAHQSECVWGLC
ncbi:hypothetical protein PybrP1_010298 [[Pythium] brassicae (nom. inval.)]|nr:hypothetical protein PybrP1_010298 [[Pythium] brassicae (nom. inval.)]